MNSTEIWKPDLYIINQVNFETYNIAATDQQLVRVWADKSTINDIPKSKVNIDWSPFISYDVHHTFNMTHYPLDVQNIQIKLESWMSLPPLAGIRLYDLKDISSQWTSIGYNEDLDDKR